MSRAAASYLIGPVVRLRYGVRERGARAMRGRWTALPLALGIASTLPAVGVESSPPCSLVPWGRPPGPEITYFIGTALPDTLEAGPAPFGVGVADTTGPPFGQLVRLARVGGASADALTGDTLAVLVPWGYAADCSRVRWTRSARWAEAGLQGLYTARLRERRFWAEGLPTFDVTVGFDPYPHAELRGNEIAGPDDRPVEYGPETALTPGELFEFLESVTAKPDVEAAVLRWVERHPEQAGKYPVWRMRRFALLALEERRVEAEAPPLAGTYRLEVRVGEDRHELFVRTGARPVRPWWEGSTFEALASATPAQGYTLHVVAARTEDAIPTTWSPTNEARCGIDRLIVRLDETADGAEASMWVASLDEHYLGRCLETDPEPWSGHVWGEIRRVDAGFVFRQGPDDASGYAIRGERVSGETFDPWGKERER